MNNVVYKTSALRRRRRRKGRMAEQSGEQWYVGGSEQAGRRQTSGRTGKAGRQAGNAGSSIALRWLVPSLFEHCSAYRSCPACTFTSCLSAWHISLLSFCLLQCVFAIMPYVSPSFLHHRLFRANISSRCVNTACLSRVRMFSSP